MDFLLIVHILAALFTVIFAVFTGFSLFHRYSIQHRIEKMKSRMMPLIIGRISKQKIMDTLKKEEFPETELEELYEHLISKQNQEKKK